jgi:hypothetical protein
MRHEMFRASVLLMASERVFSGIYRRSLGNLVIYTINDKKAGD